MDAYLEVLEQRGSDLPRGVRRKQRMIERDLGPFGIEHDTKSSDALAETVERKRAQYKQTGRRDGLGDPWKRALLRDLLQSDSPDCHGVTSRLVAGGHVLAWHFGLRGPSTCHYWFPVHAERWARYSPGLVLLMGMLSLEAERGSAIVDLGAGDMDYKRRVATGARVVYGGSVETLPGVRLVRAARSRLVAPRSR